MSDKELSTVDRNQTEALSNYAQGMKDCQNGVIHKSKSLAYDQGYSDQYAFEQIQNSRVSA